MAGEYRMDLRDWFAQLKVRLVVVMLGLVILPLAAGLAWDFWVYRRALVAGPEYHAGASVWMAGSVLRLAVGLLLLAGGAWETARLSQRATAIGLAADAFAGRGDLRQRLPEQGRDELAWTAHSFNKMMESLQEMANAAQLAGSGDLTVRLAAKSADDRLGLAFGGMMESLRALIGQVQAGAGDVAGASEQLTAAAEQAGRATQQISQTIQQVAQGHAQQATSLTQASAHVEQIARAADGVARGAQEQAAAIQHSAGLVAAMAARLTQVGELARAVASANAHVTQAAHSGASAVRQTGEGMSTIHNRTTLAAGKVQEMGRRSAEIGRIVEVIDDIADKTDMLALNAAVEAARAGEHGRGFAVVADQVRKLSEDSKAATREIATLIERVQETVREAIAAMEATTHEVASGTRLADETARALDAILQAAEEATALAERITTAVAETGRQSDGVVSAIDALSAVVEENTAAAEEMAAGSRQVSQAMAAVASVAEQSSAAAEEVSAAAEQMSAQVEEVVASAEELAALADELRTAVARFKLEETAVRQEFATQQRRERPGPGGATRPSRAGRDPAHVTTGWNGHEHKSQVRV